MRPIFWGDGTRWDDPNATWDGMLEPGDPGYVIPPPDPQNLPNPQPKPKNKVMNSNETPDNQKLLIALARGIQAGQVANEVSVGLMHHTAAKMDLALKKLTGDPAAASGSAARKGSQLLYRLCVDLTSDAAGAQAVLSDGAVKENLTGYRAVLVRIHGSRPTAGWTAAGFPTDSTAVPRGVAERLVLLGTEAGYLDSHPAYVTHLPRPDGSVLDITPAAALALQSALQAAGTVIHAREAEQELCKNARDADEAALRREVSATITELGDLLSESDPRWDLFGLNIPAHPTPPVAVTGVTLTPAGPGRILVEFLYARRMSSARIFLKRVGLDATAVNVADVHDLSYVIKDLAVGQAIEVFVVSHNVAGDGPSSPTVSQVV